MNHPAASRFLTVLALLAGTYAQGRTQTPDSIDAYIAAQMQRYRIPGLALAVIKDGRVVRQSVYGFADVDRHVPVTRATAFQIASTTKIFTSAAVLGLVDAGKLSLDDRLGTLLDGLPSDWRAVTVRQLLTHTSGLPDIAVAPGRPDLIAPTWEEALPRLATMPLRAKPGEAWAYNQTNYVLLGKIIERRTGMRFEDYMIKRVFRPLKMKSTTFGDSRTTTPSHATNYDRTDSSVVARQLDFPAYVHTAGGVFSTLGDFVRWDKALSANRVLPLKLRREAWTAVALLNGNTFRLDGKTTGYGMGWVVNDRPGHRSVGHSGGNTAAFTRFIDDHVTIVVLHNGNRNPDALVEGVAGLVIPGLTDK